MADNMKNIHLDMVRVTEAGAVAASEHVGRGDKNAADRAATDAMIERFNKIDFSGNIVIGEGRKDGAPGLFVGDKVGNWSNPDVQYDIAVDPIEGTRPTALGGYEAISTLAVGSQNSLYSSETFYMKKLAMGPDFNKLNVSITEPLSDIVQKVSDFTGKPHHRIMVCMLDRPRHKEYVDTLRAFGCRIKLISDCDVSGAIASCVSESGIDFYYGIGGAPEGVISAAALKCMRGRFEGMLCEPDGRLIDSKVLGMEDLAKGDVVFCATGITSGSLLRGVSFPGGKPRTHSVLMRSESGTVRWLDSIHGN